MAHFDVRESRFASPRPPGARCLSLSFVTPPLGLMRAGNDSMSTRSAGAARTGDFLFPEFRSINWEQTHDNATERYQSSSVRRSP